MSDESLARSIDRYRSYLLLLAEAQLPARLRGKLDASDVVQQTMLQAYQSLDQFRGGAEVELAAWMRQILARILSNAARDLGRDKRDVGREHSLEAALENSSARLEAFLAADQSSPSQRAVKFPPIITSEDCSHAQRLSGPQLFRHDPNGNAAWDHETRFFRWQSLFSPSPSPSPASLLREFFRGSFETPRCRGIH